MLNEYKHRGPLFARLLLSLIYIPIDQHGLALAPLLGSYTLAFDPDLTNDIQTIET